MPRHPYDRLRGTLAAALIALGAASGFAAGGNAPAVQTIERDDVTVALAAFDPHGDGQPLPSVPVDTDIVLRLRIAGAADGAPLSGLRPAAWIDPRIEGSELGCQDKIRGFLQGTLAYRPQQDLNSWYVLALNATASITVIDPLLQFGGQKIVTLVQLQSPGDDWALSPDGKSLFVTLPDSDKVAIVDTVTWKVAGDIAAGRKPTRAALQPDGRYLWVVTQSDGDDRGSISAIDVDRRTVAARVVLGRGPHDLAFSGDSAHVFVSNAGDGTVSVIDIRRLEELRVVKVGPRPVAIAYSDLARNLYVADGTAGTIEAIDGRTLSIVATAYAGPGLKAMGTSPDGRWIVAANAVEGELAVVDTAFNRIVNSLKVGRGADQIVFTPQLAYVRSALSAEIGVIPWTRFGADRAIPVQRIPAGQMAHGDSQATAAAIAAAPGERAVLIGNRQDRTVYYYVEGMNAPMGSFNNYRQVKAVLALDRSLREAAPGVFEASVRLTEPGAYDFAILLGTPRVAHCFTLTAAGPPTAQRSQGRAHLEFLVDDHTLRSGDTALVQFRLTDEATGQPIERLHGLAVQSVQVPGHYQQWTPTRPLDDGLHEAQVPLPQPGVYFIHVAGAERKRLADLPYLILRALPHNTPATPAQPGGEVK